MASNLRSILLIVLLLFFIINSAHGYILNQRLESEDQSAAEDEFTAVNKPNLRSVLWPKICFTALMKKNVPNPLDRLNNRVFTRNARKCYPYDTVLSKSGSTTLDISHSMHRHNQEMNQHHSSRHAPVLSAKKSIESNQKRQDFWHGTLLDDYNFLMSEELICHCKSSLGEPFSSWNDLAIHHVSYNEFERQSIELSDWCTKISETIKQISSNTLTCYLRQKNYEELYEQGLMRLRIFKQYSDKLIQRFPDLKHVIKEKMKTIYQVWNELEGRFLKYFDEDFDRILQDLHDELFLFEEWIIEIEEQLGKFHSLRNEILLFDHLQQLLNLQDEIKSKNSRVSNVIEVCGRLQNDYEQHTDQIPLNYACDLENRWHQIWINSVEIQCKLEDKFQSRQHTTSFTLINDDEEEDIIPFHSSEYEKLSLTSSTTSLHSTSITRSSSNLRPASDMSLHLSSPTYYYSLTNITDDAARKTLSKLDIGYASEDDGDKKSLSNIRKSQSASTIDLKPRRNLFISLTHSLPSFEQKYFLPNWWRHSVTSAYDTCSNPDMDLSLEERPSNLRQPSLLIYSKKYLRNLPEKLSGSYDASGEYTDAEQSENDVDNHHSDSFFYNRYTTTTTTGYSSDMEPERVSPPKLNLPIDSSEPCWDGYQNPLFYPVDVDSVETTLRWDDQFFEIDHVCNASSDEEIHSPHRLQRTNNGSSSSSSLITSATNKQARPPSFDSDSDFDDFNYVLNESERQLFKVRQTLEKRNRQQQLTSIFNQRKYDDILRTCETNIQCLQQIQTNLHRSTNSQLTSTRTTELLQTYLTDWHDIREEINADRTHAEHLLRISHELQQLKVQFHDDFNSLDHLSPNYQSLHELKHQISSDIQLANEQQQNFSSFDTDLHLVEEHLKEYYMTYPDSLSSMDIDDHLLSCRSSLDQRTEKLDIYQNQLRRLLTMIENLLPLENVLEQKLTYSFDLHELQALLDDYERMIPVNAYGYDLLRDHCEYKLDIYRKMFNDVLRKQEKHMSLESSAINFNNNNSSSTQHNEKILFNTYRAKETRETEQISACTSDTSTKQSTTSSYISDDCKVLYIETVIEVAKPVYYERTTDTISTTNIEQHHHHPSSTIDRTQLLMNFNNHSEGDSPDEDLIQPVSSPTFTPRRTFQDDQSRHRDDSGIGSDQASPLSASYNRDTSNDRLLFRSVPNHSNGHYEPSLIRHLNEQTSQEQRITTKTSFRSFKDPVRNRRRPTCLRSLFTGLLILFVLFSLYLFGLDRCSRATLVQFVTRKIIRIEHDGLPTI